MDKSDTLLLTVALGVMNFDSTDVASNMMAQPAFPIQGFVPPAAAAQYAQVIWTAGLLAVASGAAVALGGSNTPASVLAAWQAGEIAEQLSYGVVSGNVSGVALWNSLNSVV